mgnify:CR=1 FL=1
MSTGLPAFVKAFYPHKSFIVGTGGVSIEDFLSCDIETLLNQGALTLHKQELVCGAVISCKNGSVRIRYADHYWYEGEAVVIRTRSNSGTECKRIVDRGAYQ